MCGQPACARRNYYGARGALLVEQVDACREQRAEEGPDPVRPVRLVEAGNDGGPERARGVHRRAGVRHAESGPPSDAGACCLLAAHRWPAKSTRPTPICGCVGVGAAGDDRTHRRDGRRLVLLDPEHQHGQAELMTKRLVRSLLPRAMRRTAATRNISMNIACTVLTPGAGTVLQGRHKSQMSIMNERLT